MSFFSEVHVRTHIYPRTGKRAHARKAGVLNIVAAGHVLTINCVSFSHKIRKRLLKILTNAFRSWFGATPEAGITLSYGGTLVHAEYLSQSPIDTANSLKNALATFA